MKVFVWNVRGLGNKTRKLAVRRWMNINRILIGGLLETRVKQINIEDTVNSLLPGWNFDSNHSENATNGRIVVVWDPILSVFTYLKNDQMILCGVFNPVLNKTFTIAFVYARNTISERVGLWSTITELSRSAILRNEPWLVLGDFNQVMSINETYALTQSPLPLQGMSNFRDCLNESGLFDISSRGCFFTWTNKSPTDPKLRKLDRALINEAWLNMLPDSNAYFDVPGSSDHSPCLVTFSNNVERRHSRFTFFSFWTSHPDYHRLLEAAWNSDFAPAGGMFWLCQKLRAAKECCKGINRGSFSDIQKRTKEAFERLEWIQRHVMDSPSQALFDSERVARDQWLILARAEESFFQQKSRIRWLKFGDLNTSVFYKSVVANLARNSIYVLLNDQGERITDANQIKEMIVSYYTTLLGTPNHFVDPISVEEIRELHNFRCSDELATLLSTIPTADEIKETLFSLPKSKAPGPDGFTSDFFTSSWDLVGQDFIAAVLEFFEQGCLPRQVNTTVIALIPKITGATKLSDFRPISLCNTVYKVISRIISNRLKSVTIDAVQRNQVGFVKGRLLCENVLLASELVVDFNKDGATDRGCLQIDITKAYDCVDWRLVLNILEAFQLPPSFISWIRICITSPYYSIAVNGELCGFFPGKKGLRQGDSVSSSLFVMVMDILAKKLDAAARLLRFSPHPLGIDPLITHLTFADDMLVFFDGTSNSLRGVIEVLEEFKAASGLSLNPRKSCLFLNGNNPAQTQQMAASFGLTHGSLPVKYLGLPLSPRKLTAHEYQPLIDKVLARISAWPVRRLSFAGRLQLIQTVLFGIINFWLSVFLIPKGCLDRLERICSAYLWSGGPDSARSAKISWESVCTPKKAGGLGLRRLLGSNQVYGLKLIWLIFTSEGSLWVAWVKKHLIRGRIFWNIDFNSSGSWIWRRIMKLRYLARPHLSCQVQSGKSALFWLDNWRDLGPLIELTGHNGPRVTGIPLNACVSEVVDQGRWLLPSGRNRIVQLLKECLPPNPPDLDPDAEDYFLWRNNQSSSPGLFSSAKTWSALNPCDLTVPWHKDIWFKGRIPKHAFHCWVIIRDRLPTRDKLRRWGLNVQECCLLCSSLQESKQHLFFSCPYSREVWKTFFDSTQFSPPYNFDEVVSWVRGPFLNNKIKLICHLLYQAVVYYIWKERNSRLHTNQMKPVASICKEISIVIRAKLAGLDHVNLASSTSTSQTQNVISESYLFTWFRYFHPG